jgi:hypothetical protein
MSTKDISEMLPSVLTTSNRNFASSVKAIMHSRHANTRRNIKRPSAVPGIGEMIVVKEYDQMDSLREILEQPPRKCGPLSSTDDGEHDIVERVIENDLIPECQQGVKRKRDDDNSQSDHESTDEEPEFKRRRFTDNPDNQQEKENAVTSEKPESPEVGIGGKENLPPEQEVQIIYV